MSECLDLLDRSTAVKDLTEVEPEPGGHWQLFLKSLTPPDGTNLDGCAIVDFIQTGGQFAGDTTLDFVTDGERRASVPVSIDGEINAAVAELTVHFEHVELKGKRAECKAESASDDHTFVGTWYIPCSDPVGCGCSGSDGPFELTRVTDDG